MKLQPKPSSAQDGPLRVERRFDDAIGRALQVKPPASGWAAYEADLKRAKAKRAAIKKAS